MTQVTVGSRRGISPLRSHRTVRESLPSYGSSDLAIRQVAIYMGIALISFMNHPIPGCPTKLILNQLSPSLLLLFSSPIHYYDLVRHHYLIVPCYVCIPFIG
jgi:hypothetical protein